MDRYQRISQHEEVSRIERSEIGRCPSTARRNRHNPANWQREDHRLIEGREQLPERRIRRDLLRRKKEMMKEENDGRSCSYSASPADPLSLPFPLPTRPQRLHSNDRSSRQRANTMTFATTNCDSSSSCRFRFPRQRTSNDTNDAQTVRLPPEAGPVCDDDRIPLPCDNDCERRSLHETKHFRQRWFHSLSTAHIWSAREFSRLLTSTVSALLSQPLAASLFLTILLLSTAYGAPPSLDRSAQHSNENSPALSQQHHSASNEHNHIPDGAQQLTGEQEYLLGEADDGDPPPLPLAELPKPIQSSTALSVPSSSNQLQRRPMSIADGFIRYNVGNNTLDRETARAAFNLLKPSNVRPADPMQTNAHPVALLNAAEEGRRQRLNGDKPKKHRRPGERRKPLLGRKQVLLALADSDAMSLPQKCHGQRFKQRVRVPGCLTKIVVNRYEGNSS
ncbi:hypothetical protein WR25_24181 isoform A [Diploscapter pachys]|uniref:Uncharacterized protein n=1 Tax=Diploscapter pachys TaxID=2018661 RepID=A0A2A2KYU2_9BILA|nr:hypothetical protein WR25_24181 isoform A [Diploscapter pachys]